MTSSYPFGKKNISCNSIKTKHLIGGKIMTSSGQTLRSAFATISTTGSQNIGGSTTAVPDGLEIALGQSNSVELDGDDGFIVGFSGRYIVTVRAELSQATAQPISVVLIVRPRGESLIGSFKFKFTPDDTSTTHALYTSPLYLVAGLTYEVAIQNAVSDAVTVADLDIHVDYVSFQ